MLKLEQIAPNFTRVDIGNVSVWFSYDTPVAYTDRANKLPVYTTDRKYSRTTSKQISRHLPGAVVLPDDEFDEFTEALKKLTGGGGG